MEIHFDHNGQNCVAEVFYNFKEVEDCVFLVFENNLSEDILFSKVNGVWTSTSGFQTRYPQSYLNIVQALILEFDVGGGWHDLRLHNYLS